MGNKIIKPVSFNRVGDAKLLNHVEGLNFSGYVKQLIDADIKAKEKRKAQIKPVEGVIKASGGEIKFKF